MDADAAEGSEGREDGGCGAVVRVEPFDEALVVVWKGSGHGGGGGVCLAGFSRESGAAGRANGAWNVGNAGTQMALKISTIMVEEQEYTKT